VQSFSSPQTPQKASANSSLRGALGKGRSGSAARFWIRHRLSFFLLFPLTLWGCCYALPSLALLCMQTSSFKNDLYLWIYQGWNGFWIFLWAISLIYHGKLSVDVMIEDYIHGLKTKMMCLGLLNLFSILMMGLCLFFLIKLWIV
jgi:succinate dehydrogenase hydrophobic anchor subunit